MNISKLAITLATFATIASISAAFISTKDITRAVLVDKAKHSIDLTTNGLYHISVEEAYDIDKSKAAQISFLNCSFARPEFRFSWFCHQQKKDGQMTKYSYVALKQDQETYFKDNVITSVIYETQKWMIDAKQLSLAATIEYTNNKSKEKLKASGAKENVGVLHNTEQGGSELMTAGKQVIFRKIVSDSPLAIDPINEFNNFSIQEIEKRFIDSSSPSSIKDYDLKQEKTINADQTYKPAPVGSGQGRTQLYENEIANLSVTEIIKKILETGRYEDGIFYLDNPEYKSVLNMIEKDVGAKAIESIYKEMTIVKDEKLLSANTPTGIFRAANRFIIYLNTQISRNIIVYHYDRSTSTISQTFKYKEYFIFGIILVLLLQYVDSRYSRKPQ